MILPHAVDLVRTDNKSKLVSVCDACTSVFSYRQERDFKAVFSSNIKSEIEERKTE